MSDFDPGDGFCVCDDGRPARDCGIAAHRQAAGLMRVRVEPVPALPTVPYTVIRVEWRALVMEVAPPILYLNEALDWQDGRQSYSPGVLGRSIIGFEVLAEPRAVTAKTVFDRVRELQLTTAIGHVDIVDVVRTEFGAES